jgi:hypothetical protein
LSLSFDPTFHKIVGVVQIFFDKDSIAIKVS